MENILVVKIQTNVNQRKHMHNNLLSKSVSEKKSTIMTIKLGVIVLYKNLFFFGHLNAKFEPVGS